MFNAYSNCVLSVLKCYKFSCTYFSSTQLILNKYFKQKLTRDITDIWKLMNKCVKLIGQKERNFLEKARSIKL